MSSGPRSLLEAGEALRYEDDLRTGGALGITDERLLVVNDHTISVPLENVKEVRFRSFDWFLALLSLALVLFGLVSTTRHLVGGALFVAAGVASLYLTYRKRGRVTVDLHTRGEPVTFHLEDIDGFREAMEARIHAFEARRGD